ncbi:MAG TPA: GNAT family N-acetyltransferase, partial [archaeon]|nr:GNAT family N-acetyltransferase [archaeon]
MPSKVKIRKATTQDSKIIAGYYKKLSAYEKKFDPYINVKKSPSEKKLKKMMASPKNCYLIAEMDGKPIGCGASNIEKIPGNWNILKTRGSIFFMFIDAKYRNKGIGKEIIKHLVKWLKKRNIRLITIKVYANNEMALEAYKKYGFK